MKLKQKLAFLPPLLLGAAAVVVWMKQPAENPDDVRTAEREVSLPLAGPVANSVTAGVKLSPSASSRLKPRELTDLDTRKLPSLAEVTGKVSQERADAIRQFKADFPNASIEFDPVSHSPSQITVPGTKLTGPLGGKDAKAAVASFVDSYQGVFGHGSDLLTNAGKARLLTDSESQGVSHLVWEQLIDGIPVAGSNFSATVTSTGEIVFLGDTFVPDTRPAASSRPTVPVEQAISAAAFDTGMQMSADALRVVADAPKPSAEYMTHSGQGISGQSMSRLIWFPQGNGDLALAWDVTFTPANRLEMFRTLVDATNGVVLSRQSMMQSFDGQFRFFGNPNATNGQPADSPRPLSPTTYSSTATTEPSEASTNLYISNSTVTTNGWVDSYPNSGGVSIGGQNVWWATLGSNVASYVRNTTTGNYDALNATSVNQVGGVYRPNFDLTPSLSTSPSGNDTNRGASVYSAFVIGNWMHDQLAGLGFARADGAFENFVDGGGANVSRRFEVLTQSTDLFNNAGTAVANIPTNGSPRITLGLYNGTTISGTTVNRDSAFDAEILLHEYTHGMSQRLVGHGTNTIPNTAVQSRAMGEGWSDFFAFTLLSEAGDNRDGNYAHAAYSNRNVPTGFQNNYFFGGRRYPYSTSLTVNPLTFRDIDPGQAQPHTGVPLSSRFAQVDVVSVVQNVIINSMATVDGFTAPPVVPSVTVARSGSQLVVTGTNNNFPFTVSVTAVNGGADNTQSISTSTQGATATTPQITTLTFTGVFESTDTISYSIGHSGITVGNTFAVGGVDPAEIHNAGEVWCSMLWQARANIIQNRGASLFADSNQRIMRLLIAAMKNAPSTGDPTWVQQRNAILAADGTLAGIGRQDEPEIWAAFAKRGMGIGASAPAATTTSGVVESSNLAIPLGSTTVAAGATFDIYGWGLGGVPAAGGTPAQSKVTVTIGTTTATVGSNGVAPTAVPTQASEATTATAGRITVTVPGTLGAGTYAVVLSHYGWTQNVGSITVQAPEIAVEQPVGTNITDGGAKSFGPVNVGSPSTLTFTISNSGTASLTGVSALVSGTHASEFVVSSLPANTVSTGGTTTFAVTFTPGGAGTRTAVLQIASNDGDENPFDINLSGTGLVPEIVVEQPAGTNVADGSSKNFGTILPLSSTSLTFTISNTGGAPLTGGTPTIDGTNAADFVLTTSPSWPVAVGGSTSFTVTFTPGAAGARSASIHFTNNDSDENPYDISLTGTGAAPEIAVEQPVGTNLVDGSSTATFSPVLVGGSTSLTFTVKNTGTADLSGVSTSISGAHAGDFVVTAAPASPVAASGSTTLTVTFTAGALGGRTALLQIASNDTDENPFDIALAGTGTLPEITVSMQGSFPSLSDGDTTPTPTKGTALGTTFAAAQTIVKNVLIKNDGTAALNLGAITVTGTGFTTNLAGVSSSLAAGASTNLPITFQAAAAGVYQATVQIPSNDTDESVFDFVVSAVYGGVTSVDNNELVRLSPLPSSWTINATGVQLAGVTSAAILDGTGASVLSLAINAGTRTNTFLSLSTTTLPTTLTGEYFLGLDGNNTGISIYIRNTGPRLKVDGADKPDLVATNFIGEVRVTPLAVYSIPAEPGTATTTVTLTNTGEATLNVTAMPKTGTGNADFTIAPTATSYTILAGASRTITVTFNPSAVGTRAANYGITTSNSTLYATSYSAKFEGTGVDPDIELAPFGDEMPVIADDDTTPSVAEGTEYGTVAVDDYSNNWGFFTIWNRGTSPLTVASVTMLAGSTNSLVEFPLTTFSTYPVEIPPGGEDTFYVGFEPKAAATGVKYATVRVLCNDNNAGASTAEGDYRFRVQGKCLRPVLEVRGKGNLVTSAAAAKGANGTVLGSAVVNSGYVEREFRLSNIVNMTGYNGNDGMAINFDNVEILPDPAGNTSYLDFDASWPGSIWGAGQGFPNYDSLWVTCSPSATGSRSAIIKLTSNASNSATVTTPQVFSLRVKATGTTTPVLGTGPDTTDFTSHATVASGTALISAYAVDGEGNTLVAGNFTSMNGTAQTRLARFDADGVLDTTFAPSINNTVNCIVVQPDGDILIGGTFTTVNGTSRGRLARLHTDGTLDVDFRAGSSTASSSVYSITWVPAVQRWLIGGNFVQFSIFPQTGTTGTASPVARYRMAMVDEDGVLDGTFNLGVNPGSTAFAAATTVNTSLVDRNGRVWIGGSFTQVGNIGGSSQARGNLAIITPASTGGVDATCSTPSSTGGAVNCIVHEPQGTIMVGGDFTGATSPYAASSTRDYLMRLDLTAGAVGQPANIYIFNTTFTPVLAGGGVNTIGCQAGGGLVLGGLFTSINAKTVSFATGSEVVSASPTTLSRVRLARVDVNGNLDADFNPNYGLPGTPTTSCAEVNGITIDETGDIFVGGRFTYIGATQRTNGARLSNPIATYLLSRTATQFSLGSSEASPAPQAVVFERWDETLEQWTSLGAATWNGTQWVLPLSSPVTGFTRAKCVIPCGLGNASTSLVHYY